MRIRIIAVMTALLLACAPLAKAQQQATDVVGTKSTGSFDLGGRVSDISGDGARYQRYRDLGDGGFLDNFTWSVQRNGWFVDFGAKNVGWKDQFFSGAFLNPGKAKISFTWDQIPLLFSRTTETLYRNEGGGVLRLDDDIQLGYETGALRLTDVLGRAQGVDTRFRRDTATFDARFTPATDLDVTFNFKTFKKDGSMPWSASFGFSAVNEIPVPIDQRTTEFTVGTEWAKPEGSLGVGYLYSKFDNQIETLVWDSPFKLNDSTNSSAYVAGNGTSQGRQALWPDSTFNQVHVNGSYKLAGRSRLSGYFALGFMDQNAALIPYTINTAIPTLHLDRSTAEASAHTTTANVNYVARPNRDVTVTAQYRLYDFDNRMPEFHREEYVRFDQVIEESEANAHPNSIKRNSFDMDVSFNGLPYSSVKVGYSFLGADREARIFETTHDNVFRVAFNTVGNQYITLRSIYEYSKRSTDGFLEEELEHVGEQPGMRHFDIAARNRSRFSAVVTLIPVQVLMVNGSLAYGKDDYTETEFGLQDNKHQLYTVGFDVVPRDEVSFGISYGHEIYDSLQNSRQANPGAQFVDPSRDWSTTGNDTTNYVIATFDLLRAIPKTDLRFAYDWSSSKATYVYGAGSVVRTLPDGSTVSPALLGGIEQLPPITNELTRASVDLKYFFTQHVAGGIVYWYDKYSVQDFQLANEKIGTNELANAYLLGYLYRPYTANTVWLRLSVLW